MNLFRIYLKQVLKWVNWKRIGICKCKIISFEMWDQLCWEIRFFCEYRRIKWIWQMKWISIIGKAVEKSHKVRVSFDQKISSRWWGFMKEKILTPKAENRFVRLCSEPCSLSNTSDFGLGGFFGRSITFASSLMSSSSNLLSDDTDNCLFTLSWFTLFHSEMEKINQKNARE